MYKIYSNLLKHVLDDSITPGLIDNYYSQTVRSLKPLMLALTQLLLYAGEIFTSFGGIIAGMKSKKSRWCFEIFEETRVGLIQDRYLTATEEIRPRKIMKFKRNSGKRKKFIEMNCMRPCCKKQVKTFRKCLLGRKFERNNRTINYVTGVTDYAAIAEHFVSHFSRACTLNTVSGNARLQRV